MNPKTETAEYVTEFNQSDAPHWVTRVKHGPYVAYHYIQEAADQLTAMLNDRMTLRENCETHRQYAHMMQEQRSQIADYCRTLEKQIAELLAANAELIDVRAEQSAIAGELAELRSEARTADGIKWSEISEMWRHKFEAAERELADLQTKSAREVFARGVYLGPRGTGSMPKQFAPEWWYNCFNKGYHDMSIFEIEWGYDAYLKYQKTKQ